MARNLSMQYAGALYRVMNRGDRGEAVFQDPCEGIGVASKLSTFGLDRAGILLTRCMVLWQSPGRDFGA